MSRMLFANRSTFTSRDVRAGCFVCHGTDARWHGGNAQGVAAQHHDRTKHAVWCDVYMSIRYGEDATDPRQIDLEDAIAASSSGDEPEAAPLTDPDAPVASPTSVSAPLAAQSKRALAAAKPEHTHV